MQSITSNHRSSLGWSSHCIEPMGCGGPKLSLYVQSSTRPNLAGDAIESLATNLSNCEPTGINVTGQRDDLQELDETLWNETICEALTTPSISTLSYTSAYCRPGYQDKRMLTLLKKRESLPNILDFTVQDGLYGYADTFLQLYRLTNVETLALKDCSYGVVLGRDVCEALALALQSLQHLKHVELSSLCFACEGDWNLILEALTSHRNLETVRFFRLQMSATKSDFSKQAMSHPVFIEKAAVLMYLSNAFPDAKKYLVDQRLEAYLHVRAGLKMADARTPLALSVVSDQQDLLFELLRHRMELTIWIR